MIVKAICCCRGKKSVMLLSSSSSDERQSKRKDHNQNSWFKKQQSSSREVWGRVFVLGLLQANVMHRWEELLFGRKRWVGYGSRWRSLGTVSLGGWYEIEVSSVPEIRACKGSFIVLWALLSCTASRGVVEMATSSIFL
jgi:hypothetical protein